MTNSSAGHPIEYRDERILSILQDKRLTTTEISEALDCHSETAKRRLKDLEERGIVKSTKVGQVLLWERSREIQTLLIEIQNDRQEDFIKGVRGQISINREGIPKSFIPEGVSDYDFVRGWSVSEETTKDNFQLIESLIPGDIILFHHDSEVLAQGTIERIIFDPQVGEYLWPDTIGKSDMDYPITFLLTEYHDRSFSVDSLPSLSETNIFTESMSDSRKGLIQLPEDIVNDLADKHESLKEGIAEIDNSGSAVLPLEEEEQTRNLLSDTDSKLKDVFTDPSAGTGKSQKIARQIALQKIVPEVYDYRCAVCSERRLSVDDEPEIEVAHILPLQEGGSHEIKNTLALCKLHHWAFDTGWISINSDYKIMVRDAAGTPGFKDFMELAGTEINLPDDQTHWPSRDNLLRHRELFAEDEDWILNHETR